MVIRAVTHLFPLTTVNYFFREMFHHKCLAGLWIRFCSWITFNISLNLYSHFRYNGWQRFIFPNKKFVISYPKWYKTDHLTLSYVLMKNGKRNSKSLTVWTPQSMLGHFSSLYVKGFQWRSPLLFEHHI